MAEDSIIRWLHLSDFHVGKDGYAQHRIFDKIHSHVRERVAAWGAPDFVFITGDLAQCGKAKEYSMFYDEFVWPLLEVLGQDWKGHIFTIPGNHDVDLGRNQAFSREEVLKPSHHYFDPTPEGLQKRELLIPRFESYIASECSNSPSGWPKSTEGTFSQRLEVRGCKVGIVGINTAWLCKDKEDRHRLTPGTFLVETALRQIEGSSICIVLGHHPLDWLESENEVSLRSLLGQYHAIYLHGHLHKGGGRREDGGGYGFLAIQAGACFQARDNEIWLNGLLWGALNPEEGELRLQPRRWNPSNHDWPITSGVFPEIQREEGKDWWHYPLPGFKRAAFEEGKNAQAELVEVLRVEVPEGWQVVDRGFLDKRRKVLEEQDALRFFDGSLPSWSVALSPLIPKRAVVGQLKDWLIQRSEDRPRVALLAGPGGEGKSTAFLQTIVSLLDTGPSWKVLWRYDENRSLTMANMRKLTDGGRWLIATDDADLIVQDLFTIAKSLQPEDRSQVAFLLTCRDTDWRAAGGDTLPWLLHTSFHREDLGGLNQEDARQIVEAWGHYGSKGLGQLAGQDIEESVQRLVEVATKEAAHKDGAFFGAMLEVRIGGALPEHLKTLLQRLSGREIRPGVTLLDAFGYIACMDSEGLAFLSRPVLAKALGCRLGELKPKVLGPLGKEAAAVGAGHFVLTRHRMIARVAVEILSDTFQWDMDEPYVTLAKSAIDALEEGYVPELAKWRYSLQEHFLESGRNELAIRIGKSFLEADPRDIRTRVSLSKLYRQLAMPEKSVTLFRNSKLDLNRGAWYEWGVAEGESGNDPIAVYLEAFSLADQARGVALDNRQAKFSLAGLGAEFGRLFASYNDNRFIEAVGAAGVLGLALPVDSASMGYFNKHLAQGRAAGVPDMDLETAFSHFEVAVRAGQDLRDPEDHIVFGYPAAEDLTFRGLRRLIDGASSVGRHTSNK